MFDGNARCPRRRWYVSNVSFVVVFFLITKKYTSTMIAASMAKAAMIMRGDVSMTGVYDTYIFLLYFVSVFQSFHSYTAVLA